MACEAVGPRLGMKHEHRRQKKAAEQTGEEESLFFHLERAGPPPGGGGGGGGRQCLSPGGPRYDFFGRGCLIFGHIASNLNSLNVGLLSLWQVTHFFSIAPVSAESGSSAPTPFNETLMLGLGLY